MGASPVSDNEKHQNSVDSLRQFGILFWKETIASLTEESHIHVFRILKQFRNNQSFEKESRIT